MPRAFRPRVVPTLVALVLVSIGLAAGTWQTRRAEQKLALKARIEASRMQPPAPLPDAPIRADDYALRHVSAHGSFVASGTLLLDNRIVNGVPGYQVLTPLKVGATHVLVNRGWVAAPRLRTELPAITTPAGELTLTGQARVPLAHAFALGVLSSPDGRVWQQIRLDEMSRALGLTLAPIVIFQQSDSADGLTRTWDAPDYGIDMHRGYAFQWFALAALAAVFFVVMSFGKKSFGPKSFGKERDEK